MPRGQGSAQRRAARTIWLVCSRAGEYRRTTIGGFVPPLRDDEVVYRVRLPLVPDGRRLARGTPEAPPLYATDDDLEREALT